MVKKKEKRTDSIAQAEELTGIPYDKIIHSALKKTGRSLNQIDEVVYYYELGKKIPKRVYEFAEFLIQEWKRETAKKL